MSKDREKSVDEIIAESRRTAEEAVTKAREQADEIVAKSSKEADEIVNQTRIDANLIVAESGANAALIVGLTSGFTPSSVEAIQKAAEKLADARLESLPQKGELPAIADKSTSKPRTN